MDKIRSTAVRLPSSVLFACSENSLRSPMAEALLKHYHSTRIFVQSAGVRAKAVDGFACAIMDEIGLDISSHAPKRFDDLEDNYYDIVISLSPEAHHRAVELTRNAAIELEYWPMPDPSHSDGPRNVRLEAYRSLRERLHGKIRNRFPMPGIAAN